MPKLDISKVGFEEEKIKPMTPNSFIYKFPQCNKITVHTKDIEKHSKVIESAKHAFGVSLESFSGA